MRRGTTPTHTFTIPFDVENVADALIVYAQGDKEVLRKTVRHCHMEGNTLSVDLTQEETLLFSCKSKAQIQVKVRTGGGSVLVSEILTMDVEKCLSDEVI